MRTPRLLAYAAGLALLVAGLVVLLVTSEGEPPARPRLAPLIEAAAPRAADSESRPLDGWRAQRIKPIPSAEVEIHDPVSSTVPAPVVVAGEVLEWDGTPATTVNVTLYRLQDGAPGGAIAGADTDARGQFAIPLPPNAPTEGVLLAFKPGRRPATLPIVLATVESRTNLRLTLGLGAAIEGSVTLDGKPVRGARVSADLKSDRTGSPVGWSGNAFETKRAAGYSDDEGRFLLTGLAPGVYWVATDQLVSETALGLTCQAEVVAPASGVYLGVRSGQIRIRVLGKGEPLIEARLAIVDSRGTRTIIPQPSELRVATGLPFTVEAAQRGFVARKVAVQPLTAGEKRQLDVVLEPADPNGIRLDLRGAIDERLASVPVRLIPVSRSDQEGVCVEKELRRGLRAERSPDNRFVLEDVPCPAGKYILMVLPEPPASWFVPAQTEVVLPDSGVLEVALDLVPGGFVYVTIVDSDSARGISRGDYVVRDSAGTDVLSSGTGRGSEPELRDGRAEARVIRQSTRVVAAGSYEIEARSEGYRTVRRELTVLPSSEARMLIQLEKEKP